MSSELFSLKGRVAVVSGAAQGLGQASALALAQHGADLVLVDRNLAGAEATGERIRALGRRAIVSNTDVSDPDAIEELFRRVDTEFGRVDFLGNIAGDGHLAKPEDLAITDLHRVLQNLVVGRFAMCQQAGRRMLAQGCGSIMNIGSLASSTALGRGHIAYSMAMGAVIQMTRELSTEWSHGGVRVNCVTPAQVVNPGLTARMQAEPGRALLARHPRRPTRPAKRHHGVGGFPRLGCLILDHRGDHSSRRRQPGDECRGHARPRTACRAGISTGDSIATHE
jgi:NAD(P)-dependent dehydrogenase (short-subunit alcohol dehydrogenase family)